MELGMIGLGRMGGSMSLRLIQAGHSVIGYARSQETIKQLTEKGLRPAVSLGDVVGKLKAPRIIWLMIPAGDPVDETLTALLPLLGEYFHNRRDREALIDELRGIMLEN